MFVDILGLDLDDVGGTDVSQPYGMRLGVSNLLVDLLSGKEGELLELLCRLVFLHISNL